MSTPSTEGSFREENKPPRFTPYGENGFILRISATQLRKSTINANKIVRNPLKRKGLIDFSEISPGQKKILPCILRIGDREVETRASFLIPKRRGETNPEPRMWPYKLNSFVSADSTLWFIAHNDHLEVRDSET
jgi:hypothetical protein